MNSTLKQALADQFDQLETAQQRQVLEYVRDLSRTPPAPVLGSRLLTFAGTISAEDLERMKVTIAEGCESVNAGDW